MEEMIISAAQYKTFEDDTNIKATINGVDMWVPIEAGNRHYDEIMKQVEAGTLTIADAD